MIDSPGQIVTLAPVTPTGTQGGSIDWQAQLPSGADEVRISNWTPNAQLIHVAGDTHNLDPWTADVFPAYCRMNLQYTQVTVSAAAALPQGATPTLLVTVAYGVKIPGVYPMPLSVSGFVIDSTAADVKDLVGGDDAAVAGNVGKAADAGHQHPMRTEGVASVTTRAVANVRAGQVGGSPIVVLDDGANVWSVVLASNQMQFFRGSLAGSARAILDSTGHFQATNYAGPTANVGGHSHTIAATHQHFVTVNNTAPSGAAVYYDGVNFNAQIAGGGVFSSLVAPGSTDVGGAHSHAA